MAKKTNWSVSFVGWLTFSFKIHSLTIFNHQSTAAAFFSVDFRYQKKNWLKLSGSQYCAQALLFWLCTCSLDTPRIECFLLPANSPHQWDIILAMLSSSIPNADDWTLDTRKSDLLTYSMSCFNDSKQSFIKNEHRDTVEWSEWRNFSQTTNNFLWKTEREDKSEEELIPVCVRSNRYFNLVFSFNIIRRPSWQIKYSPVKTLIEKRKNSFPIENKY